MKAALKFKCTAVSHWCGNMMCLDHVMESFLLYNYWVEITNACMITDVPI